MPVRRQLVRSNSSSSNEERRDRDARRFGFLSGLKVCIINAKLEPRVVGELSDLAESKGAQLVGNPERADIVITEIGTRKRLERHISWKAAVSMMSFSSTIHGLMCLYSNVVPSSYPNGLLIL